MVHGVIVRAKDREDMLLQWGKEKEKEVRVAWAGMAGRAGMAARCHSPFRPFAPSPLRLPHLSVMAARCAMHSFAFNHSFYLLSKYVPSLGEGMAWRIEHDGMHLRIEHSAIYSLLFQSQSNTI